MQLPPDSRRVIPAIPVAAQPGWTFPHLPADDEAMLYPYLLTFHNWIRWLVLIAGIFALIASIRGWSGKTPVGLLSRASTLFVAMMDVQLLLGLIMYFGVSPLIQAALKNMAGAMKDHEQRFFTVEHTTYMIVAVVLAHVGGVLTRKAKIDPTRYRGATIAFAISLLLILAGIPWWRPLLRQLG